LQFWNQPWHDGDAEAFQADHGKLEPASMMKFRYSETQRSRGGTPSLQQEIIGMWKLHDGHYDLHHQNRKAIRRNLATDLFPPPPFHFFFPFPQPKNKTKTNKKGQTVHFPLWFQN
jgi:hypothetical protein